MLEIRHLTKIYKTKGGSDTKALDDVSIRFEEKGLVFLLGKSGSGKSTLLNVAGGLDEPTSGEVIVMGKSSRDFSGSDFDSYRNTYVGFVFQEYNVLNEFNVEDNVALALELQGKRKDKEKISALLREVDLEPYAKRKPNTLSGGQKQRIAIARALIKDPQIIMADEPTGALDSATGKQVFDTLKKLSETRLVLVVSHDREFAEIYGDRIVELKDGKIISDVTKVKSPAEVVDANVTRIGGNTLSIKSGARLTEKNLREIQRFVSESEGDVIISKGKTEIANFKKINRIDESGARERFDDTKEENLAIRTYEKGDAKFIRSRLPAGKALKIGASGLKLKPVRLIFTIFLSLIAFVMFGLFSTMMVYDGDSVRKSSFLNSDYEYLAVQKRYRYVETYSYPNGTVYSWVSSSSALFTPAEAEQFDGAFGAYDINESVGNVSFTGENSAYYTSYVYNAAVLPEGNSLRGTLTGAYPEAANEICISSYLLDCFRNGIFRPLDESGNAGDAITVTTESQIIGTYLSLSGKYFKVTGIFDSGAVPAKYDSLKNSSEYNSLAYEYSNYLRGSLHTCILVSDDFYKTNYGFTSNPVYVEYFDYSNNWFTFQDSSENEFFSTTQLKVYGSEETTLPVTFFSSPRQTLADDELILPLNNMSSFAAGSLDSQIVPLLNSMDEINREIDRKSAEYQNVYNEWAAAQQNGTEEEIAQLQAQLSQIEDEITNLSNQANETNLRINELYEMQNEIYAHVRTILWKTVEDYDEETGAYLGTRAATEEEIAAAESDLLAIFQNIDMTVTCAKDGFPQGNFRIVGYFESTSNGYDYNGVYCSQSFYDNADFYKDGGDRTLVTNYVPEKDATYRFLFIPFDKTAAAYDTIFSKLGEENFNPATDVWYYLDNTLDDSIAMTNSMVETLSQIFLWVGVVMALFAALLLFNFISVSISNKKKDIGILRAVGARGIDVFKIFFSESGIIVGLCTLLSIAGTIALVHVLNQVLKAEINLQVTIFVFGWASIAMMVAVALVVALLATFLPVYFAAKKKPVESIRAL